MYCVKTSADKNDFMGWSIVLIHDQVEYPLW